MAHSPAAIEVETTDFVLSQKLSDLETENRKLKEKLEEERAENETLQVARLCHEH